MAIANLQEMLLSYTKQQTAINEKLSGVMSNTAFATRSYADKQKQYNEKVQNYYYEYYESDKDTYYDLIELVENEHELDLARLESWEASLEAEKNELETQLNEITTYKDNWTKLLSNNIKKDFTYGSVS
ncbi:MAG: hypothetical protein NC390_05740 [Fusobacterium sp.]|nr:hypothetical protein [Fusobacterium sp.]